jgi:hypothetical protein
LLTKRSIAEAARTVGIEPQTLRHWFEKPAFVAEFAAAACEVFGPAMMVAQYRDGDAATMIKNFTRDLTIPEETRRQACLYIAAESKAHVMENLTLRLAESGPENASGSEPPAASQTIGRSLYRKLQGFKALSLQACGPSANRRMIFVHAIEGRPTGSSVLEPDGRNVWLDPPEGCKQGEPVEEHKTPPGDLTA